MGFEKLVMSGAGGECLAVFATVSARWCRGLEKLGSAAATGAGGVGSDSSTEPLPWYAVSAEKVCDRYDEDCSRLWPGRGGLFLDANENIDVYCGRYCRTSWMRVAIVSKLAGKIRRMWINPRGRTQTMPDVLLRG